MDCLPELDIQGDLENLEEEELEVVQIEDLTVPKEETFVKPPEDIFVGKPTNGKGKKLVKRSITPQETLAVEEPEEEPPLKIKTKKPVSEKQKAHLERIRIKAAEKRRMNKLEKDAIKERVTAEVKAKGRKKKEENIGEEMTEDFKKQMKLPTAEEEAEAKRKADESQFMDFMANMEKFQRMKYEHDQKTHRENEQKKLERQRAIETENRKKKVIQRQAQQIPAPHPQPAILKPPDNPYAGAFNW